MNAKIRCTYYRPIDTLADDVLYLVKSKNIDPPTLYKKIDVFVADTRPQ